MNTIEAEWEKFSSDALHPCTTIEDRAAIKMAFFAGAWAILGLQHSMAREGYSEAAGVAIMGGIYEEMLSYFQRLQNEKQTF